MWADGCSFLKESTREGVGRLEQVSELLGGLG